ncbi:MAG: hypothetical protein ACTHNP_14245 [Solirubrobacterales bacterium]
MKLAVGTKSVVATTDASIDDTCSETTLEAKTSNTGGATATIDAPVSGFTFGNCSHTTKAPPISKTLEIHYITGTDNGQITARQLEITVIINGMECTYGTAAGGTTIGTLVGPTNVVNVNTVLTLAAGSGLGCPDSVKWTATYNLARPATAVYVELS